MYLECNNCGTTIEQDWIICAICGNPLEGEKEVRKVEAQIAAWRAEQRKGTSKKQGPTFTPSQKKALVDQGLMSPSGRLYTAAELIHLYYKSNPDAGGDQKVKAGPATLKELKKGLNLRGN